MVMVKLVGIGIAVAVGVGPVGFRIDGPADDQGLLQAQRLETPAVVVAEIVAGVDGTEVAGRCTQYEQLLIDYAPAGGWSVARMSGYMWRESRCTPTKRSTTSDSGLLQINDVNHPFLRDVLGEPVDRWTLFDPVQNVRAAAALCAYWSQHGGCYLPWN